MVGIIIASIGILAVTFFFIYKNIIQKDVAVNDFPIQEFPVVQNEVTKVSQPAAPQVPNQLSEVSQSEQQNNQNTVPDTLEKQAYVNTAYGFQINPPKDWKMDKTMSNSSQAMFSYIGKDNAKVDIVAVASSSQSIINLGLDEAADKLINGSKAISSVVSGVSFRFIESKKIIINNLEARIDTFSIIYKDKSTTESHLFTIKNDKGYLVLATVMPSSAWDKYKKSIEDSMMSFKLIK